ncbi:MAG: hypothetical protein PF508_14945, partial [Spirochaeta sp.]|nr:hypothetical protein [Spirochaeta sp.]
TGCGTVLLPEAVTPPETVDVEIPPLPAAYAGWAVEWAVTWWDGGRTHTQTVNTVAEEPVSISLQRSPDGAEIVLVSAVPRIPAVDVRLRPYGGWVYPPAVRCSLSLHAGALARALIRTAQDGLDPALVNVARIQEGIEEELSAGARRIDRDRLEEGLRSLAFRRYHIRPLDESPLEVRALASDYPASGDADEHGDRALRWITDDPANPRVDAIVAGEYLVWAPKVAPGTTRSMWRVEPAHQSLQKMTLSRSTQGHGSYHIFTVSPAALFHDEVNQLVRHGDHLDHRLAVEEFTNP